MLLTFIPPAGGQPEVPVRLTGSQACNKGRVEVFKHGMWGQVR